MSITIYIFHLFKDAITVHYSMLNEIELIDVTRENLYYVIKFTLILTRSIQSIDREAKHA